MRHHQNRLLSVGRHARHRALLGLALIALWGAGPGCGAHSKAEIAGAQEVEMKVWFDGEAQIATGLEQVSEVLRDPGRYHLGVVTRMPGLSSVELLEQGADSVSIRTNEGMMARSNIVVHADAERVVVEFDEVYSMGTVVTANAHFKQTFTPVADGVSLQLVISGMEAPGLLGFVYRSFGSRSIGKAILETNQQFFESL